MRSTEIRLTQTLFIQTERSYSVPVTYRLSLKQRDWIINLQELLRGPNDFDDFPDLKEYFHDAKGSNPVQAEIESDLKTKGFE